MEFTKKIIYASAQGYENIDLEPSSQTYVSVIIKDNKVFLTSINHFLEEVSPEYLINSFCGSLLVNNIDCYGYEETSFIQDRTYNFKNILSCNKEDFGSMYYETLLRFSNLCKAAITESNKNKKVFFIEMCYADDYLEIFTEETDYPIEPIITQNNNVLNIIRNVGF